MVKREHQFPLRITYILESMRSMLAINISLSKILHGEDVFRSVLCDRAPQLIAKNQSDRHSESTLAHCIAVVPRTLCVGAARIYCEANSLETKVENQRVELHFMVYSGKIVI